MSFALYSGSFCQFFLGEWETDQEKSGEEIDDLDDEVEQEFDSDDEEDEDNEDEDEDDSADDISAEDLREFFNDFQDEVGASLKSYLTKSLRWDENPNGSYRAYSLSERNYIALMIAAARSASTAKKYADFDPDREWTDDPAIQALQGAEQNVHPVHHLVNADTWLPGDFEPLLNTELPERDIVAGSLTRLDQALATVKSSLADETRTIGLGLSSKMLDGARLGLAAFELMTAYAKEHKLPLIIES